MQIPVRQH